MPARRPWRTATLVAALALTGGCSGQDADPETHDRPGPRTAPASSGPAQATPSALAGPPTQAQLDRVAVRLGLVPARILARSRLRSRLRVRRVPDLEFPLTIWCLRRTGDADLAPVLGALDHALGARLSRRRRPE